MSHEHQHHHPPTSKEEEARPGMWNDGGPGVGGRISDAWGNDLLFLQPPLPSKVSGEPRAVRDAAGRAVFICRNASNAQADGCQVHVPHASRGRPGRARYLSQVRHGAGADDATGRRRRRRYRTARHEPPVLDVGGVDDSRLHPRDGADGRNPDAGLVGAWPQEPVGTAPGDAGRALGRMAVLRASLAGAAVPHGQHVHAHRARDRRGMGVQRRRDRRPGLCSPPVSATHTARCPFTLKRRRSS